MRIQTLESLFPHLKLARQANAAITEFLHRAPLLLLQKNKRTMTACPHIAKYLQTVLNHLQWNVTHAGNKRGLRFGKRIRKRNWSSTSPEDAFTFSGRWRPLRKRTESKKMIIPCSSLHDLPSLWNKSDRGQKGAVFYHFLSIYYQAMLPAAGNE